MANIFSNAWRNIKNIFYVPVPEKASDYRNSPTWARNVGGSTDVDSNLSNFLVPVQQLRIKQTIDNWRASILEAERPILPFRYLMQTAYLDTMLDTHLLACVERRKNLTLLRGFNLVDDAGNINEQWTNYLKKSWFKQFMSHSLDAIFYGYSLISLGDIENNDFKNITVIRRGNISPDRLNVAPVPYSPDGAPFMEEPYSDWHIWIPTPNDHGLASCGYGLLYPLTFITIMLKNNLIGNGEYCEVYTTPFRQLKSDKKNEDERRILQAGLENMGNNNYMITGTQDELVFHDSTKGSGYKAFSELEKRLEAKISKIILGHADAIDATPGRLGSQAGTEDASPVQTALNDIQALDGEFIEPIINEKLLPIIRKHGIPMPDNLHFCFTNDREEDDERDEALEENSKMADFVQKMSSAGYKVPLEYLKEFLGIDFEYSETTDNTDNLNDKSDKSENSGASK